MLAGAIEGHAGAGLGLWLDGGMADDFGKDERWGLEGQIAVPGLRDCCREGGASLRDAREACSGFGGCCGLHLANAVMSAVSSAAGGETCFGSCRDGEQRQDQREAEEEKQSEAESASHRGIVGETNGRMCQRVVIRPGAGLNFGQHQDDRGRSIFLWASRRHPGR